MVWRLSKLTESNQRMLYRPGGQWSQQNASTENAITVGHRQIKPVATTSTQIGDMLSIQAHTSVLHQPQIRSRTPQCIIE
ncbi:MAG: hypothetical protein JWM21_1671 [Acidobacteria bacterium]|nr:hypothetical protein [Acidobacteriota bacterium]